MTRNNIKFDIGSCFVYGFFTNKKIANLILNFFIKGTREVAKIAQKFAQSRFGLDGFSLRPALQSGPKSRQSSGHGANVRSLQRTNSFEVSSRKRTNLLQNGRVLRAENVGDDCRKQRSGAERGRR